MFIAGSGLPCKQLGVVRVTGRPRELWIRLKLAASVVDDVSREHATLSVVSKNAVAFVFGALWALVGVVVLDMIMLYLGMAADSRGHQVDAFLELQLAVRS